MNNDEFIEYVVAIFKKHGYSNVHRNVIESFIHRQMAAAT